MEAVTDFLFLSSKSSADGDSSQEIKRYLHLGRKALTKLESLLKSRDINLPTKVHIVKIMVFQYSYTDVRVALQRKLSAKELMLLNWCWGRLLRISWTAR